MSLTVLQGTLKRALSVPLPPFFVKYASMKESADVNDSRRILRLNHKFWNDFFTFIRVSGEHCLEYVLKMGLHFIANRLRLITISIFSILFFIFIFVLFCFVLFWKFSCSQDFVFTNRDLTRARALLSQFRPLKPLLFLLSWELFDGHFAFREEVVELLWSEHHLCSDSHVEDACDHLVFQQQLARWCGEKHRIIRLENNLEEIANRVLNELQVGLLFIISTNIRFVLFFFIHYFKKNHLLLRLLTDSQLSTRHSTIIAFACIG
jgi:hypothetical protein